MEHSRDLSEICHCHGRRFVWPREGHQHLLDRRPAEVERIEGLPRQDRPVPERRCGHDESVPARGGVRPRRRFRGGPGPRQLRAIPRRQSDGRPQHHDGQSVSSGHREGATRGLPRADRADHPARHGRDQSGTPRRRREGAGGYRLGRSRGDRRGHRGHAVPRGGPATRTGDREGEPAVREYVVKTLRLEPKDEDMREWKEFLENLKNPDKEVTIALVGKYTHLKDSYISHIEAFHHAGAHARVHVKLRWVESVDLEKHGTKLLEGADGILVPGGFGDRGIEGKIAATRYAAENEIPFQGVCLGFQLATIGFARDVLGLKGANSSEFDPKTPHPVVDLLPEQRGVKGMGATMRLGAHEIDVDPNSTTAKLYGATTIYERHRHRYEINPAYIPKLEDAGLRYVGRSDDGRRMEVLELKGHRYFVASQFHPELRSRPLRPSPIHLGLVRAAAR